METGHTATSYVFQPFLYQAIEDLLYEKPQLAAKLAINFMEYGTYGTYDTGDPIIEAFMTLAKPYIIQTKV